MEEKDSSSDRNDFFRERLTYWIGVFVGVVWAVFAILSFTIEGVRLTQIPNLFFVGLYILFKLTNVPFKFCFKTVCARGCQISHFIFVSLMLIGTVMSFLLFLRVSEIDFGWTK
jgi:hypothetical protein